MMNGSMCFSATASFAASAGLAGMSVATYRVADKKHKILASLPALFAIQQGLEGIQWLSVHPGELSLALGYLYLFFAFLLWPVYVPFLVGSVDAKKHHVMRWFIWIGAVVSAYLFVVLMQHPLNITIYQQSINYSVGIPLPYQLVVTYVFVICGSMLASSHGAVRWFGVIIFISAILAGIVAFETFTSVWCFFAAILSSLIFFYVRQKKNQRELKGER